MFSTSSGTPHEQMFFPQKLQRTPIRLSMATTSEIIAICLQSPPEHLSRSRGSFFAISSPIAHTRSMAGHSKWAQIKRQKGAADKAKSNLWGKLGKRIAVESKIARGDVNVPGLRAAIERAKKENMPKDTIDRAVAKGAAADSAALESIIYEAYGPGGAAILIEVLTDSRNRAAQEIKHLLSKSGIALASPGSALWAFDKSAEGYEPKTTVQLTEEDSSALMKILGEIDDYDDTENVYTNAA